ncbi:MAG: TusE/DsrC/DsvC family sulfur relay protein [Nitrospirota bacterium]
MQTIDVQGKSIMLDDEGYLLNAEEWDETVACAIAEKEGVITKCPLTPEKMGILRFMRSYYKEFNSVPIPRAVCKNVHQQKNCTYEIFPDPVIAWKIAGLPQPSRHIIAELKGLGGVS